jgi:hypothetical protein
MVIVAVAAVNMVVVNMAVVPVAAAIAVVVAVVTVIGRPTRWRRSASRQK